MRLSVTLLFASTAFATLVSRQSPPQCALTCIATANTGTCSSTDNKCLCANQAFVSSTTSCIESTCTGSDLQSAVQFAQADCAAVGVTLTESVSGSPTASGSGSATSASASSTQSSSGAIANNVPVLAIAALGFSAFVF